MMNSVPEFTEKQAALLQIFLTAPERPKGTMTFPQLAGFLFSVACGPDLVKPSEWLPIVFNEKDGHFKNPGEVEQVFGAMRPSTIIDPDKEENATRPSPRDAKSDRNHLVTWNPMRRSVNGHKGS